MTSTVALPAVQSTLLGTLQQRYRDGESVWPIPLTIYPAAIRLWEEGLVELGQINDKPYMWLTDLGIAADVIRTDTVSMVH